MALSSLGCSLVTDGENYTNFSGPRYFSSNETPTMERAQEAIKVVSYNVRFSQEPDLAGELLKNHLDLADADIIFLQEMDPPGVEAIAKKLNYNYVYYPAVRHPLYNRDFGNAILTKWPIIHDKKVILPHLDPDKLQRIAVGAVIKVGDKFVMAYSLHMRIWLHPFQRKNQMERLLHSIPPIDYCIIAGDFNTYTTFNRQVIEEAFQEHRFTLATEGVDWTYKHWYLFNKKSLMDYIFVKNMVVLGSGSVKNREASDHLPVWAQVKLKGI